MEFMKLDFEYSDDVTVINEEQFKAHMRLYEGYVNIMNEIDYKLAAFENFDEANATYSEYRGLKRGETFALNGVILHEFYFENIGEGENTPEETVQEYLAKNFGSFEAWKEHFIATAKVSRGWVILCYDVRSDRFRNISLDAHDLGNIALSVPILVLDMYEHAYFLQYKDNKEEYINNFMKNIDWSIVGERLESLY
jgi:Fe-Mn family superoxide dismutase